MRRATERITLRFTPTERGLLSKAIDLQRDSYRGISYHLRTILLRWATEALRSDRAIAGSDRSDLAAARSDPRSSGQTGGPVGQTPARGRP